MARNHIDFESIFGYLKENFSGASTSLRSELQGTLLFEFQPGSHRYLLTFKGSEVSMDKISREESREADCTMQTTFKTFGRILNGDLNPQLSLVGDKVTVKGKAGLAIYVFNLLSDNKR